MTDQLPRPRHSIAMIPMFPSQPIHLPESGVERFTVGFEKRNRAPLPEEIRPQVVQSSIPLPPPYPRSANENVDVVYRHGQGQFREGVERYQSGSYRMMNLPEPHGYHPQNVPNYHRTILSGPMNQVSYQ